MNDLDPNDMSNYDDGIRPTYTISGELVEDHGGIWTWANGEWREYTNNPDKGAGYWGEDGYFHKQHVAWGDSDKTNSR